MSASSLLIFLSLAAAAAPASTPAPAEVAGDDVLADLAGRRPAAAIRGLRRALGKTADVDEQAALRCLLGHAHRTAGQDVEAIAILEQVPLEAGCGPRAAFDRADALLDLGRDAEAAAIYAAVGAPLLGEGRDEEVARRLERLIGKVQKVDGPSAPMSSLARTRELELYSLALSLTLPPARTLSIALAAGDRLVESRDAGASIPSGMPSTIVAVLHDRLLGGALSVEDDARCRRMAALLGDARGGLALLDGLPAAATPEEGAANARVRAEVAWRLNRASGLDALEMAVAMQPDDAALRGRLVERLVQMKQLGRARPHLLVLSADDEEALLQLASLDTTLSPDRVTGADAAAGHLSDWLARFPTSPRRRQAETALARARLDGARAALEAGAPAAAVQRYDAFLAAHPTHGEWDRVAWEAAEAARLAGNDADARTRFEERLARGQSVSASLASLFELRAADGGAEAAMAWLEGMARGDGPLSGEAMGELDRRRTPALSLEAGPVTVADGGPEAGTPVSRRSVPVRLHVRNVDALTLRLHHIDPEALLRAGGRAEDLPDLDVAVIAPDREWPVALAPGAVGVDRIVELPVELPGPGLYALTAATDREQAQVVLRAGDGRVLGRGVGEDLVLGILDGDRPDPGARVLVAMGGRIVEEKADRNGIIRLNAPEGEARVLAMGRGGPALLDLSWGAVSPTVALRLTADVDRPVVLPGDQIGYRIVGRRGDATVQGTWSVWLRAGGVDGEPVAVVADERGALVGDLTVPNLPASTLGGTVELVARAPGEELGVVATRVRVVERARVGGRRLVMDRTESGGPRARVEDADGLPVSGVAVEVRRGQGEAEMVRTGPTGELLLPEGPVPGALRVRLVNGVWKMPPVADRPERLMLSTAQEQPTAGAPVRLRLEGEPGLMTLHRARVLDTLEPLAVPQTPRERAPDAALDGPRAWNGPMPPASAGRGELAGTPMAIEIPESGVLELDVEGFGEGRWVLRAVPSDPRLGSSEVNLQVGGAAPVLGAVPSTLVAGQALGVAVDGPAS